MTDAQNHPMQPVVLDKRGTPRFKENAIVRYLLDHGGIDLNQIARLGFSAEDQCHFAQLIGYSTSGYGDLSYTEGHWTVPAADRDADAILALNEKDDRDG